MEEDKKKTLFDALYNKIAEVDGVDISYGTIGDATNPAGYVVVENGQIRIVQSEKQAAEEYRKILVNILRTIHQQEDTELPW